MRTPKSRPPVDALQMVDKFVQPFDPEYRLARCPSTVNRGTYPRHAPTLDDHRAEVGCPDACVRTQREINGHGQSVPGCEFSLPIYERFR
jgi:hypothetical protein